MLPFSLEFLLVHPLAFLVVFLKIERHLVGSHPRGVRLWIERQNLSEIEESQNRAGGVRGMKRKGADSQIDAKLDAMGLGSLISAPELTAPPQLSPLTLCNISQPHCACCGPGGCATVSLCCLGRGRTLGR